MIRVEGTYYDGLRSGAQAAAIEFTDGQVALVHAQARQPLVTEALRLQAQVGATPRRLTWGTVASFATLDQAGADALTEALPHICREGWIHRLEARMSVALACLVIVVAGLGLFATLGIPLIAEGVARATPEAVSQRLGNATLDTIDQILDPSELSFAQQQDLADYFRSVEDVPTIEFRKAGDLGPNALTLSATTIVITDELVALAENDAQLMAVYLHEVGHARAKHVERSILQNAAWAVMLALLTGDATGASELVLTLPVMVGQMAYSRELEREADQYAMMLMYEYGLDPLELAAILGLLENYTGEEETAAVAMEDAPTAEELEQASGNPSPDPDESRTARILFDYFSTHPATQERIEAIHQFVDSVGLLVDP